LLNNNLSNLNKLDLITKKIKSYLFYFHLNTIM
jgi:hypothetical protein